MYVKIEEFAKKYAEDAMTINTILWDVDGTLLDFELAEHNGLRECMGKHGISVTDEQIGVYKKINQELWEMLERGEITKPELGPERFRRFLVYMGYDVAQKNLDLVQINADYQEALSDQHTTNKGALEVCEALRQKGYRQYIVTNGTAFVQRRKNRLSGIDAFMEDMFISEELGSMKPEKAFFGKCAERIADYDSARTMIIGDSLTSDMRGGNHAGITCCWYNPKGAPNDTDVRIDYEIRELSEVLDCLAEATKCGHS